MYYHYTVVWHIFDLDDLELVVGKMGFAPVFLVLSLLFLCSQLAVAFANKTYFSDRRIVLENIFFT